MVVDASFKSETFETANRNQILTNFKEGNPIKERNRETNKMQSKCYIPHTLVCTNKHKTSRKTVNQNR